MADTIVVVGNEAGDDFSTTSAAYSSIPSDLTATGGNYEIQIRTGATTSNFFSGSNATDSTHRLVISAFPGDEVNGKGEGASIVSGSGLGVIRTGGIDFLDLKGLLIKQTGTSRCVLFGSGDNPSVTNCQIRSTTGQVLQTANGAAGNLTADNVQLISDGASVNLDFGNSSSGTVRTLNRVTSVGSTSLAFERVSSTEAEDKITNYTNCLAFTSSGQSFQSLASNIVIFDSDFNAADDLLGTENSKTTGFNSRVITNDLVDPNGTTPDYNVKQSSALASSGSDGGFVGSSLGAESGVTVTTTETLNSFDDNSNVNVDYNVTIDVTESNNPFSDSSTIAVTSGNTVDVSTTETVSAFTDRSTINVSVNVESLVTEVLNSFLDGSNVTIAKDIELSTTEVLASFNDNSSVRLPNNWVDKPTVVTNYTTQTPATTIWIDKG